MLSSMGCHGCAPKASNHTSLFHHPPETRYAGKTLRRELFRAFSYWLFQNLCLAKTWAAKDIFWKQAKLKGNGEPWKMRDLGQPSLVTPGLRHPIFPVLPTEAATVAGPLPPCRTMKHVLNHLGTSAIFSPYLFHVFCITHWKKETNRHWCIVNPCLKKPNPPRHRLPLLATPGILRFLELTRQQLGLLHSELGAPHRFA